MQKLTARLMALVKGDPDRPAKPKETYWLTRFVLLRLLGFVYLFAYLSLALQVRALIGHRGILPADLFLHKVQAYGGDFWQLPSLFWLGINDTVLVIGAWTGVVLSSVVLLGYANAIMLVVLWFLYMSYVHIGQLFYGYGWEMQMIETGLLAVFLVPLLDGRPFPRHPTPTPVIWLFRWLLFRVELGTALIKLRADECWKTDQSDPEPPLPLVSLFAETRSAVRRRVYPVRPVRFPVVLFRPAHAPSHRSIPHAPDAGPYHHQRKLFVL